MLKRRSRKARATLLLIASFSVQDDIDRFGDVGSLEDNVESFLSNDGGDGRELYGTLKQSPKQHHKDSSKGNLKVYTLCSESWSSFFST